jgi:hypothetical protein
MAETGCPGFSSTRWTATPTPGNPAEPPPRWSTVVRRSACNTPRIPDAAAAPGVSPGRSAALREPERGLHKRCVVRQDLVHVNTVLPEHHGAA